MINELNLPENILLYFKVEPCTLPRQDKKSYLAISLKPPVLGEKFMCNILYFKNGELHLRKFSTTPVEDIIKKNEDLFIVETCKAFYITFLPTKATNNISFARDFSIPRAGEYSCFNEIIFFNSGATFSFNISCKTGIKVQSVIRISKDIYYIQTKCINYFVII